MSGNCRSARGIKSIVLKTCGDLRVTRPDNAQYASVLGIFRKLNQSPNDASRDGLPGVFSDSTCPGTSGRSLQELSRPSAFTLVYTKKAPATLHILRIKIAFGLFTDRK